MDAFNCAAAFNSLQLQVRLVDLSLCIKRTVCSSSVCDQAQVNGVYLPLGAQYKLLPTFLICNVGDFTHLTYISINRGVERCREKIPTGPLNMFGELPGSLTSQLKGRWVKPESAGAACACSAAALYSSLTGARHLSSQKGGHQRVELVCAVHTHPLRELLPRHWDVKHGLSMLSVRMQPSLQGCF